MSIDLDWQVSFPLRLSHTYLRHKLSDVAKGLCYLHSHNVVHGDLKGVRGCSKSPFTAMHINIRPAEHPYRRVWSCADHGIWPS